MTLLIVYVLIALLFSFICSIAEAVILSVSGPYIAILEQEDNPAGILLHKLKADINKPLAAILTLNTIAHTIGAAGAGAQAAKIFGNTYVGIISAILTLLILIFSEIIPKSLGAHYWRQLAPITARFLVALIFMLYPFVMLSKKITRLLSRDEALNGFSRSEFAAMVEIGKQEGKLEEHESRIIRNLFLLHETRVSDVMTPRPVVFSVASTLTVADYFDNYSDMRFSRIPIYDEHPDQVIGFVLKDDLLLARARGNGDTPLPTYRRDIAVLDYQYPLSKAFDEFLDKRAQIMLAMDRFGGLSGIITLEDLLETLLGVEIVDEADQVPDMRKLARRLWHKRALAMGIKMHGQDTKE
ncbi:CNNM domain-containing protein [Candidatus Venteria ishoeyi]|uniref:CNNM domain-containing protein n=1 Tax=Candidatus Venteria ishoeyi TaxID=1899563 RepID=UPI0025A681EE|nr:CNNM domain-containing protein [Candidatus Venteria ishoeyi]MDM8546537.1 CNNM domain-containing protein [Candidatus Venteria ishoeyi]